MAEVLESPWPAELLRSEILSPYEILKRAGAELEKATKRRLVPLIKKESSDDDDSSLSLITFDITVPSIDFEIDLLQVRCHSDLVYPAEIMIRGRWILIHDLHEGWVVTESNDWDASASLGSDIEFHHGLAEVLASDPVRMMITSLIARATEADAATQRVDLTPGES